MWIDQELPSFSYQSDSAHWSMFANMRTLNAASCNIKACDVRDGFPWKLAAMQIKGQRVEYGHGNFKDIKNELQKYLHIFDLVHKLS